MARTILITGASRGIGLELARQMAARGDRVIATARRPGAAADLEQLTRQRGNVELRGADVRDPVQLEALASGEHGAVDLVVCNAGEYIARGGLADPEYTAEAWSSVLMTNVAGPFFTVRAFLAQLERAAEPKVAVISSIMASSERAPGQSYIYRASKAAATNLARNLAAELKDRGIAVGAYHPGWVRTDMGGSAAEVSVEDSARGLIERFDRLTLARTGVFEDYQGQPMPY